jgi:enoyl-CoA hydratase
VSADVQTLIDNKVGRIRLARPKALHALTRDMCQTMTDALVEWRADPKSGPC